VGRKVAMHVEYIRVSEDFFIPITGLVRGYDTLTSFDVL
jgi:hypothetical protein